MTTSPMMRVSDVATRLNCSVSSVYALIESRRLAHHRCPGIRISEEQLAAYLEQTKREHVTSEPVKAKPPHPRLRHITIR